MQPNGVQLPFPARVVPKPSNIACYAKILNSSIAACFAPDCFEDRLNHYSHLINCQIPAGSKNQEEVQMRLELARLSDRLHESRMQRLRSQGTG